MTNSIEDRVQQLLDDQLAEELGFDPDGLTVLSVEKGILSLRVDAGCLG